MKFDEKHIQIDEIRAESLILAYGLDSLQVDISCLGIFFRYYCEDIIEIHRTTDQNAISIDLSRDGMYHLLPETLFFLEDRLVKFKNSWLHDKESIDKDAIAKEIKKINEEKIFLRVFFKFFDTVQFRIHLSLEQEISGLVSKRISLILENYFDFDIEKETNILIRSLAPFILFSWHIRGDMCLLAKLLTNVVSFQINDSRVEIHRLFVFHQKEDQEPVPELEMIVHIKGLTKPEYMENNILFGPFFYFVSEWLMPFETETRYIVRDTSQPFILENPLILAYNTQF